MSIVLFSSVAAGVSFGAIPAPTPDTTPASSIAWEDKGGAEWTLATGTWDAKDATYAWTNGMFNMEVISWQKGMLRSGTQSIRISLLGGTVVATEDVSFNVELAEIVANASATMYVAEGKTLDITPFTMEAGAAVTKTGAGSLKIAPNQTVSASAGTIVLGAGAYDLSMLETTGAAAIKISAPGVTLAGSVAALNDNLLVEASIAGDGAVLACSTSGAIRGWPARRSDRSTS